MDPGTWLVAGLFLVVAVLYSSVGFGGASSYLAVMSYFEFTPAVSASIDDYPAYQLSAQHWL